MMFQTVASIAAILVWYSIVLAYYTESTKLYKTDGWEIGEKMNNYLKAVLLILPFFVYAMIHFVRN